jgi:hypothetical protein
MEVLKALIFPWYVRHDVWIAVKCAIADSNHSGLVLASAYLSTATPIEHSSALDKPLHTLGAVLLLTGLAIVAIETWGCRTPPLPPRYIAIRLEDGHGRPTGEETWTEPVRRRAWSVKGALSAVLLLAMCGRIAIFHRVVKDVECTGPSAIVSNHPAVDPLHH